MPFTPFHFGPALLIGFLAWRYLDFPTFVAASVIVDFRATMVFFGLIDGPLHGFMHTFAGALVSGLVISAVAYKLEHLRSMTLDILQLEQNFSIPKIVAAGVSGTSLHLLLDSIIYSDVNPFWPLQSNPLLIPGLTDEIYLFCTAGFIAGLPLYMWRAGLSQEIQKLAR